MEPKSMELALDRMRNLAGWLPGYELVFELHDDECLDDVMISRGLSKILNAKKAVNRLPMFITVPCPSTGGETIGDF